MAGEYTLSNGIQTDWNKGDSTWKAGVDSNWKIIDWSLNKCVEEALANSSLLPLSPTNGQAFLIKNLNEIWVWNSVTSNYDKINIPCPIIYWDKTLLNWYQFINGISTLLNTGAIAPFYQNYVLSSPQVVFSSPIGLTTFLSTNFTFSNYKFINFNLNSSYLELSLFGTSNVFVRLDISFLLNGVTLTYNSFQRQNVSPSNADHHLLPFNFNFNIPASQIINGVNNFEIKYLVAMTGTAAGQLYINNIDFTQ